MSKINNIMINKCPGESKIYKSADSIINEEKSGIYPQEYLNTIDSSSLPPHLLEIKVAFK